MFFDDEDTQAPTDAPATDGDSDGDSDSEETPAEGGDAPAAE